MEEVVYLKTILFQCFKRFLFNVNKQRLLNDKWLGLKLNLAKTSAAGTPTERFWVM